jgi:hypothetical protein
LFIVLSIERTEKLNTSKTNEQVKEITKSGKKLEQKKLRKIKTTKASFKTRDRSSSYNRIRQGIPNNNNAISKEAFISLRNNRKFS